MKNSGDPNSSLAIIRELVTVKTRRYFLQPYIKYGTVLFLLFVNVFLVPTAFASNVYIKVDDNEVGQGVLRQRGSECLIVTPAHIIENAFKIDLTVADRSKYSAEILELFPGDIGVLRLIGDYASVCRQASWSDAINLDSLLEMEKQGELRTMLADGSIRITPVDIVAYDKYRNINVRPKNKEDAIAKGESGSSLYISGQLAGMLLTIKGDIGNVIRQDTLANIISLFFRDERKSIKQGVVQQSRVKIASETAQEKSSDNGQEFSGVIAQSAVAEYRVKLEGNSPVRLVLSATGDREKFTIEILDSARRVVYQSLQKRFSGTESVNIPFTPPRSDTYSLHIIGVEGEGKYAVKILPIAFDAQLRAVANVLQVGGPPAEGMLAKGAIAEYRIKLEENSPIRLNFLATGDEGQYTVEILDSTGKMVYREPTLRYSEAETIHFPFTPPKNDVYFLHIVGAEGEGRYAVKILSIAFDAQLRSEANVLQSGGPAAEGRVAKGTIAEYRFKLEANSPMRLNFLATGGDGRYRVEILDSTGKIIFRDPYKFFSGAETANIPFTASRSDIYSLHIIGTEGEVQYTVRIL